MAIKASILLFDLDGTLTDPKEGIINSIHYALKKKGIIENQPEELLNFIGPPLHFSFQNRYHLSDDETIEMVRIFREYFAEKGIFENSLYSGIPELLKALKKQKKIISLATAKPTHFAKQVLDHFQLSDYVDFIAGANTDGSRTDKKEIVAYAKEITGNKADAEYLMIGDREYDIMGAHFNQIEACWVSYGYGEESIVIQEKPEYVCESVSELANLLL
ncbi:MAG: HAD hydrolase-like protein [Bacteroidales bacterium]|nr:HAD hydrolase-like protein [Bacteroidales bacterium]